MSDAIAYLSGAPSSRGGGSLEADLVLKGGRIFDLVRRPRSRATSRSAMIGSSARSANIAARARSTCPARSRSRLHRHPLHVEFSLITPLEFDRCCCPWRHHFDLRSLMRSPMCSGGTGLQYFLDASMLTARTSGCNFRAALRRPSSRPPARGWRSTIFSRSPSSESAGPRGIHEFSGRPGARPVLPRQARRVPEPSAGRP